ncbi:MAG TPA: hypothetical protein DCE56_36025 [Cyanobacteria bacterium UBA8553]|nr:hypothetical protein [Cyanobacteria bacterium UBA8553]HAJ61863.1 hypothetical protein [Cyanobacteria bacterium UBA8543]
MERGKLVAIITGVISLILAIAYLALVQFLDSREMIPAPVSQLPQAVEVAHMHANSLGTMHSSFLPPTSQQPNLG